MSFLSTRIGALLSLAIAFAFVFNPYTKFPFTMIVVIAVVFLITYLQYNNFRVLGLKKFTFKDFAIVLILFACIELTMDFLVQPELSILFNEPADYSAFSFLEGKSAQYFKYLGFMWISAAIGEELLFRAFSILQLEKIVGKNPWINVPISALLFALPHYSQGPTGIAVTFIFGLAFAAIYVKWRNIWINILVHGLVDTFFLTLAYFGMLSYFG
ncbi:MAG: CPBP family intramembrane metalloprotease [Flavobacterium sp.]|uniref:CPBP family intramembrane glutamic endopeptidase n=1 Tax=Flavobacterium sp. TaxID=239 RepID=UPI00121512A2|nr:type II CAAX endopeptidase family protein [Flavobacterium sp.]RZJ67590.1 MAG: CPBP family intramembrane metalloprotease [Flavobacterium sp.]